MCAQYISNAVGVQASNTVICIEHVWCRGIEHVAIYRIRLEPRYPTRQHASNMHSGRRICTFGITFQPTSSKVSDLLQLLKKKVVTAFRHSTDGRPWGQQQIFARLLSYPIVASKSSLMLWSLIFWIFSIGTEFPRSKSGPSAGRTSQPITDGCVPQRHDKLNRSSFSLHLGSTDFAYYFTVLRPYDQNSYTSYDTVCTNCAEHLKRIIIY